jgi:hypothetical protein
MDFLPIVYENLLKQMLTQTVPHGGLPQPSEEEVARRKAERSEAFARVRAAVSKVVDPAIRAVFDLHAPDDDRMWSDCKGCDPGAYAESGAIWPCSTIHALAPFTGITESDLELL